MRRLYRKVAATFAVSSMIVVVFFTLSLYERNKTENGHYLSQLLESVEANIERAWDGQQERMQLLKDEYLDRVYIADYIISSDSQMISGAGLDILKELMDIEGIAVYSEDGDILLSSGVIHGTDSMIRTESVRESDGRSYKVGVDSPGFFERPEFFFIAVTSGEESCGALRIDVDTEHLEIMSRQEITEKLLSQTATEYDTSILAVEKDSGRLAGITKNNDQEFKVDGVDGEEELLSFLASFKKEDPKLVKVNGKYQRMTVREAEDIYIAAYSSMGGIIQHMIWTFFQGLIGIGTVSFFTILTVHYHIKRMEHQLSAAKAEASRDRLTELYNRSGFEKKAEDFLSGENPRGFFILFDLDNFKRINDFEGHPEGDRILRQFAGCLTSGFRKSDYVGRLGGDEFVVLIPNYMPADILEEKLEAVLTYVRKMLGTYHEKYEASVSAGVVPVSSEISSYQELYQCADTALYIAKYLGKDRYYINNRRISCMKQECINCRKDCPRSRILNQQKKRTEAVQNELLAGEEKNEQ